MRPDNQSIRQFISTYFNDNELGTFCFDYFPEVQREFTNGMVFSAKVMLLIGYCQRRGLWPNLLANLAAERAEPFAEMFHEVEAVPPLPEVHPRDPRRVFISHAHEDAELAQRLAADLEAEGWPVWIAPDSILPGEKWVTAVSRGLDECGVFVLLLTPHAVASRWVRHETDVAVELEQEGEMRLIPLQVEACRIPALWRAYQRIPFRGGYAAGLARLLAALAGKSAVERPATAVVQTSAVSKTVDVLQDSFI
ncbi:MAG: toll/interleukin-1 receptor domain-containing protein, partial [Chloroflexi bacterium]